MKKLKLPKEIYASIQYGNGGYDGDSWIEFSDGPEVHVCSGDEVEAGVYVLSHMVIISKPKPAIEIKRKQQEK